jgi:predicted O-methyltransferase YrrM
MRFIYRAIKQARFVPLRYWPQLLCTCYHYTVEPEASIRAERIAFDEYIKAMDITSNWMSKKTYTWLNTLSSLRSYPLRYLEIGGYEGLSVCFVAKHFPQAQLESIDTWEGSDEHLQASEQRAIMSKSEERFDRNTQIFAGRIQKHKGLSAKILPQLEKSAYDVIYVDGSHYGDEVLYDALAAWPLLKKNGVMIFDDFTWRYNAYPPNKLPNHAVRLFLKQVTGEFTIRAIGLQVFIQKTATREDIMLRPANPPIAVSA